MMARWVPVCRLDDVADGGMDVAECDGARVLLVRRGGRVFAMDPVCTHEDADLSCGFLTEGGVVCPLHLSAFDPETGRPGNPPAEEPLRTFKVKIENGTIHLEV